MTESNKGPGAKRLALLIAVAVFAVILIVVGVFAFGGQGDPSPTISSTTTPTSTNSTTTPTATADPNTGEDDNTVNTPSPVSPQVLPEAMSGQEAIDTLGDKIQVVANRNGMTVDDLKALLLRDSTVHVSTSGDIFYRDDFGGAVIK